MALTGLGSLGGGGTMVLPFHSVASFVTWAGDSTCVGQGAQEGHQDRAWLQPVGEGVWPPPPLYCAGFKSVGV